MGKGSQRNEPCWCGSQKKYKHCHLSLESASRPTLNETLKGLKQSQRLRHCLHPDARDGACRGEISQAHTVPRRSLETIARSGHVYQFNGDLTTLIKNDGAVAESLVGMSRASTFTGFCEHHDGELFAPLEKKAFVPTPETAFLLTLRAVAREIHDKTVNTRAYDTWRQLERGRSADGQQTVREAAILFQVGVRAALRDLYDIKRSMDAAWSRDDYSESHFLAFQLPTPPVVMCSGFTDPKEDFDGNKLQDIGDVLTPSQSIAFTSFADGKWGWCVFSWMGQSSVAAQLVDSLERKSAELIPHAILQFIFESFSNTFMSPSWWDALSDGQRAQLRRRMQASADISAKPRSQLLVDDGLRVVDWNFSGRFKDPTP